MDRQDIHTFVKAMSGPNVHIDDHKEWVNIPCVLAKWTHESGTDNSPSFGISISDVNSTYHCFTCGGHGDLSNLVSRLSRLSGKDYPVLEEYVESEDIGGLVPEWVDEDGSKSAIVGIHDDMIYNYDLAGDHPYLTGRGVSKDLADSLGLRVDRAEDTNDGRERIVFPVYSTISGSLVLSGFTGRAIDDEKVLKVKDYYGVLKSGSLLGIEHIKSEHKFICIVEGLFAYTRLSGYGKPTVAIMGSNMSVSQAQMLMALGKPVYLFFDNDKAGRKAEEQTVELLDGYLPIYTIDYPNGTEGLDPDDLTRDEIDTMIDSARLV